MTESLEYIEAYFEQKLDDKEKQLFEKRCINDEGFAGEVAFYITSREAVRQKLLEQKRKLWATAEDDTGGNTSATLAPVKKIGFTRWLPYAVAACLLVAVCIYFLFPTQAPRQLATTYIQQNFTRLSHTMDGSKDSLQKGIEAYNSGDYDAALSLFEAVYNAHPDNSEAKEYTGLSYLMKKEYSKALVHFNELADKKLFSNPGLFLKAVTLLERDEKGDREAAKSLLEQVRNERLEGKKQAEEWLKKW
jgi:tetratricopeptide (TPR) repeat protein